MIVSEREEDNGLDCINMQNYFFYSWLGGIYSFFMRRKQYSFQSNEKKFSS